MVGTIKTNNNTYQIKHHFNRKKKEPLHFNDFDKYRE